MYDDAGNGTKPAEGISEVELYGDVVMRFVSENVATSGPFCLPRCEPVPIEPAGSEPLCYGLQRLDHAVGNVHDLLETVDYISNFTDARIANSPRRTSVPWTVASTRWCWRTTASTSCSQ